MNIFVGGASNDTENQNYIKIAEDVGNFIVEKKHNLVFCGCEKGLVGKTYSKVVNKDSSKIYVTTTKEYTECLKNKSYEKVYVFDTVCQRKDFFMNLSNALFFLPGGIGTVDEIMTAIETKRTNKLNIPIIIFNVDNYFRPLFEMLDKIYEEELADKNCKNLYFIANSLEEAINYLDNLYNN